MKRFSCVGAVLALMVIDVAWTAVTVRRGVHIGAWLYIDLCIIAGVCLMFLYERGRALTMRPVYFGLAMLATSTIISYWLERQIYFP